MSSRDLLRLLSLLLIVMAGCTGPDHGVRFHGIVVAATPEASQAGALILKKGGNAIDAAVAVSLALAVTEPFGSGLGGQTVFIVHPPDADPFVINGSSRAPGRMPDQITAGDLGGRRATTIPSTIKVLDLAWRRFGSGNVSWRELVEPAIQYADRGYRIGPYQHRVLDRYGKTLEEETARIFLRADGTPPPAGATWRQPRLAATLRRIAATGADVFYSGEIAGEIASDMAVNDGWITAEDLSSFPSPPIVKPLQSTYRGWDVFTLPPPYGGWVVLQALGILKRLPAKDLRMDNPRRIVWLAEALRAAHRSREVSPIADFEHPQPALRQRLGDARLDELSNAVESSGRGETTHFSVVDKDGLAVGVTASINAFFGAKVAHPQLGFLYNDYMHEFELADADHPYALRERAFPYSSMSGTIVARDGMPQLVVGSPGSKRIISTVTQFISLWIDGGQPVERVIAVPRLHATSGGELFLEEGTQVADIVKELEERGFKLRIPVSSLAASNRLNPYFGGVHAIALENDEWRAAADPRRDGEAMGPR